METLVKVIQALAPLVTVGLAVFGLLVWHWQLAGKRKFEIAEQAVTVWRQATDAISFVRNPFARGGEGDSIALDEKMTGKTRENAKRYRFIFERLNNIGEAFKEVRVTQILVDMHIGADAARAFDALFRVRHLVRVDAEMLIEDFEEYIEERMPEEKPEEIQRRKEYVERRKQYRQGIVEHRNNDGKPSEGDAYSRVLDEAAQVLEAACKRILRPKTFREFLFTRPAKSGPHMWSDEAKRVLGIRGGGT